MLSVLSLSSRFVARMTRAGSLALAGVWLCGVLKTTHAHEPRYPVLPGHAVWQWSVQVPGEVSPETQEKPRAFLWIPPRCEKVRAVVLGQHNMEEEPLLEHPLFRQALEELDFAAIWVTPPVGMSPHDHAATASALEGTLRDLADVSGYGELARAPVVPVGHSAAASFPWSFAAWRPDKTLAAVSISGQWPFFTVPGTGEIPTTALDGVPGLVTLGEYEWASDRAGEGLRIRGAHPRLPLTFLAEPGGGHFDVSVEKVSFLGLYLRQVARQRLPDDPAKPLRFLDPTEHGWLVERWRANAPGPGEVAPVSRYRGDRSQAFWCVDEVTAQAVTQFGARYQGLPSQLVGYEQGGRVMTQDKKTHQQVTLPFLPEADGITFRLRGVFLDTVPEGRPEKWTKLPAGSLINHAREGGAVAIQRICGPVAQLGPDLFQVCFDRLGFNNRRRSNEIWLLAEHSGGGQYRRAVQQALMRIPLRNREGKPQTIHFPDIPDQNLGVASLALAATSDSGEAVRYYVREGPAQIEGDRLVFTLLPPRARLPVAVTVVAWQWGRGIEPKLQSAEPVSRTFYLR